MRIASQRLSQLDPPAHASSSTTGSDEQHPAVVLLAEVDSGLRP